MFLLLQILLVLFCITKADEVFYTDNKLFSVSCVNINHCKPMFEVLEDVVIHQTTLNQKIIALLRSYNCGFDGTIPKVWCGMTMLSMEPPDITNHPKISILPYQCGMVKTYNQMRGAGPTGILEFPWMARIFYEKKFRLPYQCEGTIITEKYILTTAYCISNPKNKPTYVRVGDHTLNRDIDYETTEEGTNYQAPPFQNLSILELILHPKFNSVEYKNDIGLIKVSNINLAMENVVPICLPLDKLIQNYDFAKHPIVTTSGWPSTRNRLIYPDLRKALHTVVDLSTCRTRFKFLNITPLQICALRNQYDNCIKDSGVPLQSATMYFGESRIVQHGILSFGPRFCNRTDIPDVFTKVGYYVDWILDTITP